MTGAIVRCPACGGQNRVPQGKDVLRARCGQCGTAFSQWLDQPGAARTAQRVNENRPDPARTAASNNAPNKQNGPAQPTQIGAAKERLVSSTAIEGLLLAFVPPAAVFTAIYHLYEFGDSVGALVLILLAAPMAAFLPPGVRASSGRIVLILRKILPVTGAISLAMSALFLMAEPDLTATAGEVLGHIAALPGEVVAMLVPVPPPPEPEVVRTQLTVIDDILDLLDD